MQIKCRLVLRSETNAGVAGQGTRLDEKEDGKDSTGV